MKKNFEGLSRRERQIMDIIYRKGSASAADIQHELPDRPNYSTVRALLRILEEKGHLKHKNQGLKYIYYPLVPKSKAVKHVIGNLLNTFFDDSIEQAVSALLEYNGSKLTKKDLDRLQALIDKARKEE